MEAPINIIDLRRDSNIDNMAVLVEIKRGKRATLQTIAFVKYDDYQVAINSALIKQYCLTYAKQKKAKEKAPSFGIIINGTILIVKR